MKITLMLSAMLCFTAPVFSALTPEDMETLRTLIREETLKIVKPDVEVSKKLTSEDIETLRALIREDTRAIVKAEVVASENRIKEYVNIKIQGLDERLDFMGAVVIALVAALIAVVGVPLALRLKRERAEERAQRTQDEKLETLWQEREARRQERSVNP